MKKIFLTLAVIVAACATAMAQVSVYAGYVNSSKSVAFGSADPIKTSGTGFTAGAGISLELFDNFCLNPGIALTHVTSKGAADVLGSLVTAKGTENENFLNIPVRFSYSYDLLPALKVYAFAGPNFSLGLTSKTKYEGSVLGAGASSKVNNFDNEDYQKFDTMVGIGAGVDIADAIRVLISYDFGCFDLNASDAVKVNRNQLTIGVGYLF